MDTKLLTLIALILVIIGGINWGLIGLFQINLVGALFGNLLGRVIYILVGVAAAYLIYAKFVKKTF